MRRILVSNDDGIEAAGIGALVTALSGMADVYVVAPNRQKSAMGQAMTMRGKLTAEERELPGAERAWAVDGTPVDCVKFGLMKLRALGVTPDVVVSGINMGRNAGTDIHYSGTVAAAMEGALYGYPALALSVGSHEATHFDYLCDMLPQLLEKSEAMPRGIVLNVNTPDLPKWEIKGVRVTACGARSFSDDLLPVEGEENTYRYDAEPIDYRESEEESDLTALWNGYATITPLTTDRVDRTQLNCLQGLTSETSICLLIDVQEQLLPEMKKSKRLMQNLHKLTRCLGKLGMPTLVTEQYSRERGALAAGLLTHLDPFEKIEKLEFDCTQSPAFATAMRAFAGKNVVLAGLESHIAVQQTALGLLRQGYRVTVLKDCCGARRAEDGESAMALLAAKGCTVTTVEAFLCEVLGSTTHLAYRAIHEILQEQS